MTQDFIKITTCGFCNGPIAKVIAEPTDVKFGTFRIRFCDACHLGFTDPRPSSAFLPSLYGERTSTDFSKNNWLVNFLRTLSHKKTFKSVKKELAKSVPGKKLQIFDYGTGDGFTAKFLSNYFSGSVVLTSDFHEEPPIQFNGTNVEYLRNSQLDFDYLENEFDLIVCKHVLEHSLEPITLLSTLNSLLRPNSILFVEIPSMDSKWADIFKNHYFPYYVPRHITHFTMRGIYKLFSDYNILVRRSHTPIIGNSLGSRLGYNEKLNNLGLPGLFLFPIQVLVDSFFRKSSTFIVWVRKYE
jgi:SAM-dependent methyltransferase